MHVFTVVGPPGTGKTSYIVQELNKAAEAGWSPVLLTFTRAAAREIRDRHPVLPPQNIGTLHSMAMRAIGVGADKIIETAKNLEGWNEKHKIHSVAVDGVRNLEDAQYAAYLDRAGPRLAKYNFLRATGGRSYSDNSGFYRFVDLWTKYKLENGLYDFTDVLEIALKETDAPLTDPLPKVIFVDEAQDMTHLEMSLVKKWAETAGRLVLVGDPNQNLYAFRGASADNMPTPYHRVLPRSYRVNKRGYIASRQILPPGSRVKYEPTEHEGSVDYLKEPLLAYQSRIVARVIEDVEKDNTVMIVSPTAFMLNRVISQLKDEGVPFFNPFRVKQGSWNPLTLRGDGVSAAIRVGAFLAGENGVTTGLELRQWVDVVKAQEVIIPEGRKTKARLDVFLDDQEIYAEELKSILTAKAFNAWRSADLAWLKESQLKSGKLDYAIHIAERSPDALLQTPKVIVGTIHSVKGAECDSMYLMDGLAGSFKRDFGKSGEAQAAVRRMFYVGLTRHRTKLTIVAPVHGKKVLGGIRRVPWQKR